MTVRAKGYVVEQRFPVGTPIRYRPGSGTYGFEDVTGADGRIGGVVEGYSATRVRIRLTFEGNGLRKGRTLMRCVDVDSCKRAVSDELQRKTG